MCIKIYIERDVTCMYVCMCMYVYVCIVYVHCVYIYIHTYTRNAHIQCLHDVSRWASRRRASASTGSSLVWSTWSIWGHSFLLLARRSYLAALFFVVLFVVYCCYVYAYCCDSCSCFLFGVSGAPPVGPI